jgi:hypothetical protein
MYGPLATVAGKAPRYRAPLWRQGGSRVIFAGPRASTAGTAAGR